MIKSFLAVVCVTFGLQCAVAQQRDEKRNKMAWWQEAKFGLFLHWGLYSATAGDWKGHPTSRGEQFMMVEKIPVREYATIADTFNPVHFDAEKWALMAKNAGMKYVVVTAKHHDGFAMYGSQVSDYNIVRRTPYAHDPMKDLVAACHRHGLKFGFYYSLGRDWEDPDAKTDWPVKGGRSNTWDFPDEDAKDVTKYYGRKVLPQIRELVTQYGKIDILWFDTPELTPEWESRQLRDTILHYQPTCIINNRIGNRMGDYTVYEQSIVDKILFTPWESCVTISTNWAYNRHDTAWKSANVLVRQLADIVSKGGNYLLNLSPKGNGTFATHAMAAIDSVGYWLRVNGEAIYGTHPWIVFGRNDTLARADTHRKALTASEKEALDAVNDATSQALYPAIRFTQKGNCVYAILCNYPAGRLQIEQLGGNRHIRIKKIILLHKNKPVKWTQAQQALTIEMPHMESHGIPVSVLKITI